MAYSQATVYNAWRPACRGPWAKVAYPGRGVVYVRPAAAEAFQALSQTFRAFNYGTRQADTGGQVCRTTASGAPSKHAPGIATDTNWLSGPYGTRRTDRPRGLNEAVLRIRTNNGRQVFNNGIFWRSGPDPMHDEIICLPSDLATGIDWSTVPGGRPGGTPSAPAPDPVLPEPEPAPEPEPEEDDEIMVLRLHHDMTWWLYQGALRSRVTDAEDLEAYNAILAPQGKVEDLRNDRRTSEMHLRHSRPMQDLTEARYFGAQNNSILQRIARKLGVSLT